MCSDVFRCFQVLFRPSMCWWNNRQFEVGDCRANLVDDPMCTTYLNSSPEAAQLCALPGTYHICHVYTKKCL